MLFKDRLIETKGRLFCCDVMIVFPEDVNFLKMTKSLNRGGYDLGLV